MHLGSSLCLGTWSKRADCLTLEAGVLFQFTGLEVLLQLL